MSLESWFQIEAKNSTISREIIGGVTTFVALSYIIFVQPVILSQCGMDKSAVMFATCFCSALACLIMGFWANLPIALAPAMGHNFFFAFTVCGATAIGGFGLTWQEALAANCIAGALFLLLSIGGIRTVIMQAVPEGLKFAIAAGIGLLIAYEGFKRAGIIVIGCYMLPVVRHINWDDFSEALPAFLTIMIMPFAMSITDGIAWGFIAYAALKLFAGKPRQCPLTVYCCAVLFALYYLFNFYV